MFTMKATYDGYSGGDLWLSYSGDNYMILYDSSAVHMDYLSNQHLHAPADNFPLAVNAKEVADYGDRGSWRDFAFNMEGIPVVFNGDQIAQAAHPDSRLCLRVGDDRRVYWSTGTSDPNTNYLKFTRFPWPHK